ncbi:hypothetical protein E3N88_34087 [Mikania micrantha]|uniref:Uncharacterized protein n=1 Tax=Mikania micrantha TaxID=192012 RepID=A0A5N6MDS6_9ASTR|nr:hypothetical protein E3N88_34087 [Mikania micrantha]
MAFGKHQHNTQGETETYISDTQEHDYVDLEDEVQQTVPKSTDATGSGASGSKVNKKSEDKDAIRPLIDEVTFQGAD